LPVFLLTVAALEVHMIEEYLTGFGPAMSRLSQPVSNRRFVADMPNYWIGATGAYYFPGLYTAVLPMIPGIYAISKVIRTARSRLTA
jgi:hypothetical protein